MRQCTGTLPELRVLLYGPRASETHILQSRVYAHSTYSQIMFLQSPKLTSFPLWLTSAFLLVVSQGCRAAQLPVVPKEIASSHFIVTINGHSAPVMHAAQNLYFLNFEAGKRLNVSVTVDKDDFWTAGVEVQPWRLNIRPTRKGRTITFQLNGAAQISISRPSDFFADSEMLYLFANRPAKGAPTAVTPRVRYFGPGVYHQNIDAAEGDNIYLAPGAVIFGSLNVWQVNHVNVSGTGVIVYDGPQNPADDDGWMHKRNWHCIVMDQAHDITIEDITCVVRSRTWQIQMKDSRRIVFDNIKVIGANAGNANADGMDWLGGGDTIVRNSFFRAADDIFAMQTSWEGYGPTAFAADGQPVTNITVENNVLSTSISNIVRAGWPEKNFEGGNFLMRNSDVLHMGLGGCGIPFALMELWADPHGRGRSAGFHFEDIRMEDWYSLVQLQQPSDGIREVSFTDVAGLETPSLVPSTMIGDVQGVAFHNVRTAGEPVTSAGGLPLEASNGAASPVFVSDAPQVRIRSSEGLLRPGDRVRFEAVIGDTRGVHYTWTFGDGARAEGRKVRHKFPDSQGTLMNGTGRFRVLLQATDGLGRHSWSYKPVIISDALRPATMVMDPTPGVRFTYRELGDSPGNVEQSGIAEQVALTSVPHRATNYQVGFDGAFDAPEDGGYTFLLVANEEAAIDIDGVRLGSSLPPIAQVCGLSGMAARAISDSTPLAKGWHHLHISETHMLGKDDFRLLWQGPGFGVQPLAPERLFH